METETKTVGEQALQWIRSLPQATQQERAAFAHWLKQSPRHVDGYLRMLAVEREFLDFDNERAIDVDRLIMQAKSNVVPFGLHSQFAALRAGTRESRRRVLKWVITAAVIAAIGIGSYRILDPEWELLQEYTTGTGQQQQVKLSDGSMISLNAETTVRVNVRPDKRDIHLVFGEALFDVHHDPTRPFRVHVGVMTIEDVGTQFNVRKRSDTTQVSVIEGEVKVFRESQTGIGSLLRKPAPAARAVPIVAGKAASFTAQGQASRETDLDLQKTTAWRQRMLIFQNNSLQEIVAEFNRYNVAPKLSIDDAHVGTPSFSGIFRADDPKSFVAFLRQETDLMVDMDDGNLLITRR